MLYHYKRPGDFSHGNRLPSAQRNPVTRETPYDNFVCDACCAAARPRREFVQGKAKALQDALAWERQSREEDPQAQLRFLAQAWCKIEDWQMP